MEQHTRPGEVVLEPFSGSGSQLLAAEKLGRRCRAIEIQPAFVDVALRRWERATGKGRLRAPGRTSDVAAERKASQVRGFRMSAFGTYVGMGRGGLRRPSRKTRVDKRSVVRHATEGEVDRRLSRSTRSPGRE
jgi:hypothetical protein